MQAKHTTTVLVVTVMAGLLFGISASNAREQGSLAETDLAGLVAQQQNAVVELEESVDGLRRQQDDLVAFQIPAAQEQSAILALRGELVGPGLTVMLDDAPADFQMNALWLGGAEAMSVQGVRITASTPVRCVGNVILVGVRSFAPPYRIMAIGNVAGMTASLDGDESVRLYREDAARYQMGWDVTVADRVTVPAANELSSLQFASIEKGS